MQSNPVDADLAEHNPRYAVHGTWKNKTQGNLLMRSGKKSVELSFRVSIKPMCSCESMHKPHGCTQFVIWFKISCVGGIGILLSLLGWMVLGMKLLSPMRTEVKLTWDNLG